MLNESIRIKEGTYKEMGYRVVKHQKDEFSIISGIGDSHCRIDFLNELDSKFEESKLNDWLEVAYKELKDRNEFIRLVKML